MSGLYGVPVDAAYHVVSAFMTILSPLLGGLAAAAAIVVFTMVVRLLMLPLSYRAMRGMDAQARIAPQVQALRTKHAGKPDRLQRELTALYKSKGTSMFAGCLPMLLQWPFFSIMYLVFRSPTVSGSPNSLLTHDLFSAPLGSHWLGGTGPFSVPGLVFAAMFALLAGIGWLSYRIAQRMTAQAGATGNGSRPSGRPRSQDLGAAAAGIAVRLTPYLTVVFAAFAPLAAGLYLLTTTAWTLAERTILRRKLMPVQPKLAGYRTESSYPWQSCVPVTGDGFVG
jgi:YidC/Oxa1 family membrane protein insertase